MTQKNKARLNWDYVRVDAETGQRIAYLSQIFGKTQKAIMKELIDAFFEISSELKPISGYWLDTSQNQVTLTVHGRSNLVLGKVLDPSSLGDRANEILDEKTLENEMKTLAIQAHEDIEKAKKRKQKAK